MRSPLNFKPFALSAISAALAMTMGCPDDDLVEVAPEIFVDVCTGEPQREVDGVNIGGIEECLIDFGTKDLSVRSEMEITITNPSAIDLSGPEADALDPLIIELTSDSDPSFKVEVVPQIVEGGLSKKVLISFRPTLESEVRGRLVIKSDAKNLAAEGQDIVIDIVGIGVDNGVPNIEVTPGACDYQRTAVNSVKECAINIKNTGSRDLVFDSVVFLTEDENGPLPVVPPASAEPEVFGFFGRAPKRDDVVPAPPEASEIDLTLRFEPDALGIYRTALQILTNDPDTPEIIIPLNGIGVDPPTCAVKIESVNGLEGSQTIEPLDDVILTAVDSTPSTASGEITEVKWEIVEKPAGSTVLFTNPTGLSTGFTFDDDLGLDLTGRYRVRAIVLDEQGTESVNPCEITFDAIPSESFLVELSWDTSSNDMDLHLTKRDSQGRYCPSSVSPAADALSDSFCTSEEFDDCYFGSCKASSSNRPDWDGDNTGESEGDPTLDIDDLSGYGPENINIETAVEGEYLVGVDYWGGTGPVGNTARVYLYGQLAGEFYRELSSGDFWEVAVIKWPADGDGVPCLEDLSTPQEECP